MIIPGETEADSEVHGVGCVWLPLYPQGLVHCRARGRGSEKFAGE